eukprot:989230-Lingulodinium_polyedra.AAC.1
MTTRGSARSAYISHIFRERAVLYRDIGEWAQETPAPLAAAANGARQCPARHGGANREVRGAA